MLIKSFITTFAFLVLSCVAQATDFVVPSQKIVGTEKPYESSEMALIAISPIQSTIQHLQSVDYQWTVLNSDGTPKNNIVVWPDNTKIFFGVGKRDNNQFTVLLHVSYLYAVKDADGKITEVALRTAKYVELVKVGNGPSPPDPGPGPNPTPDPVFPPGQFGLSKFIYDLVKPVNIPNKARATKELGMAYRGVDARIAAGVITSLQDALQKTASASDLAYINAGVSKESFAQVGTALQDRLYDLYTGGKLVTTDQYRQVLIELAIGLEAVK